MNSLEYNTERKKLIIPEYGRHVHQMIDQAVLVKDKAERNKMAKAIIGVMGNLNPHLRDVPDFQHKLWAQLFIMSDFKLDVDSPYPIPTAESFVGLPDEVPYPDKSRRFRHYGSVVKNMIAHALKMEQSEEKDALVYGIAYAMKRNYLKYNKDTVSDQTILGNLLEMSEGKLKLGEFDLPNEKSFGITQTERKQNQNNRKKKNKKRRY